MSPIDDQLRALLQSRADDVAPAPDPLGGIASRARGLRRRRMIASAAGAAVVVAGVAVAVPLAVGGGGGTAVRLPGETPTADASPSGGSLDPAHPWAPRGQALTQEQRDGCNCSPLFALQTGPWTDIFGVSTDPSRSGLVHWHMSSTLRVITTPTVTALPADLRVLSWALDGQLVAIAAPDATVEYASEGDGYQQISGVGQAPAGVGVVPLDAEDPNDSLRVREADGTQIVQPAPDWMPANLTTPVNVLATWVHRGDPQSIPDATVVTAFDNASGGTGGHYRSLYDGTRNGLRFTLGQAWDDGATAAQTVAYDSSGAFFLGPQTPRDPWVLGAVFAAGGKDLLVLLPRPDAGRVGYSPDATSAFTDVASGRSDLQSVGLVDRDPRAQADRVQVHRGDDSVILTEGIDKLTCAAKECG
jgi:hypothetical protein